MLTPYISLDNYLMPDLRIFGVLLSSSRFSQLNKFFHYRLLHYYLHLYILELILYFYPNLYRNQCNKMPYLQEKVMQ